MTDRWEFPVTDAAGNKRVLVFAAISGCLRVSSPTTWTVDPDTYREILTAWSDACDAADWHRGVPPS